MTRYLLVDGYNIIFSWKHLAKIAKDSFDLARHKLCNTLCDYQGLTGQKIILVFDAHMVEGGTGSKEEYNNITVIFTKEAETADHYIEQQTWRLTQRDEVTVATSDKLEQMIILSHGAIRMSASDLQESVRAAKSGINSRYLENKPVKNNPLAGLLDAETAKKLDDLRYEQKKDKNNEKDKNNKIIEKQTNSKKDNKT
ncbi:MAG: NYN domain-containing protein [Firmicutes bacterium]|nr:NYN domain-containing protein [Bacillota bacterium]